eukprot:s339_g27.t1
MQNKSTKCAYFTCNESEDGTGTWELNLWECISVDRLKKIDGLADARVKLLKTTSLPDPVTTGHWQIWADEETCRFKCYDGERGIDCFEHMAPAADEVPKLEDAEVVSVSGTILAPRMPGMQPDEDGDDEGEGEEEEAVDDDDTWINE